jgi:copper homeostasis protein
MTRILLEVCVADVQSLDAALEGGADRIELCAALEVGGLTPSPGLMRHAAGAAIPVYAMIRPRSGDFVFDAREAAVMLADIAAVREAGLAGVVLGASLPDGGLDVALLEKLTAASGGLGKTLHRAFDLVPDLGEAVETAIELGFERILTSGRAPTAVRGLDDLARIHALAAGRIGVMPGSGVRRETLAALAAALPLTQVHASCAVPRPQQESAVRFGFSEPNRRITTVDEVRALRKALDALDLGFSAAAL